MRLNRWGLASTLVFYGIAASICGFTTHADAATECLSGPKGDTPQGKHWYYRVEHPSKRHCWYLGDEGRRTSRESVAAESSDEAPPEKPAPKQNNEPLQPAVANARAEMTKDISVPFTTMPPIGQQQAVAPQSRENTPPQTNVPASQPNNWSLAERWVDPQTSTRVAQADANVPPAPAPSAASAPAPTQPITIQQRASQPIAVPAQTVAASEDAPDMMRMALGILTAAIALAAIMGRLIASHLKPRPRPVQRRAIWQTADETDAQPVYARARVSDPSLRARAEQDVEDLLRALRYPDDRRVASPVVSANRGRRM